MIFLCKWVVFRFQPLYNLPGFSRAAKRPNAFEQSLHESTRCKSSPQMTVR